MLKSVTLVAALLAGWQAAGAATRPDLSKTFAAAPVRHAMQQALGEMIRSAIPDPKNEFAGFLPKTGFVLVRDRGRARLWVIENPDAPFLRRLAALYDDAGAVEKLLRLTREEEPERTTKLASYTIQRVLERLERDRQEKKLSEAARRNIVRAVIEELVATASIDSPNRIIETIRQAVAQRGLQNQNLLGYGFSLVEYESPNSSEWESLRHNAGLFCVRFSQKGFTVYRMAGERQEARSYTTGTWPVEIERWMARVTRSTAGGKAWMGLSAAWPLTSQGLRP